MPTLIIMRHAKSAWDTGHEDHQRPLNARGKQNAYEAAAQLRHQHLRIDRVLCSTAQRTRQTLERLIDGGLEAQEMTFHDEIYESSVSEVMPLLRSLPNRTDTALLIGHFPCVEDLVLHLAVNDHEPAWEPLLEKFVTAGSATLEFATPWNQLRAQVARLTGFVTPRKRGS